MKPHFSFSTESIAAKDSRDINDEDRERLAQAVTSSPHDNILVTHGTFTMQQTAQYLSQTQAAKKVVLTGSMIPLVGFPASDAGFNLGFVVGLFASIENGVYLSMNGGIFTPDQVAKNTELFRFE